MAKLVWRLFGEFFCIVDGTLGKLPEIVKKE